MEEYLLSKGIKWSHYDIVRCYMIMGGIPYYLNLLEKDLSFSQNIDHLFFEEGCELWDEFYHLYNTLFTNSENYIKVVEAVATKRSGLTRSEIVEKTGLKNNGDLSKVIRNLELSGFIRASRFYQKKKKDTLYQLRDYYTAFYLRYIKDNYGKDEHFWSNSSDNPARAVWEGLTFEQVCRDHMFAIKQKLGIAGILTEESSWFVRANGREGVPGAEIDLLIKRRNRVITVCEIKFVSGEYLITKEYDLKLRNKMETFRTVTNCRDSIQLVMITTYGVRNNEYSSIIQNQVMMEDLFLRT